MPLLIFAGFPRNNLNADGLQHAVETVEELAILEHDPTIQYRKEGVFIKAGEAEEKLQDVEYRMSDLCLRDGITWDWFGENWSFGNGVTVHKTLASPTLKVVVHGTDMSLEELLHTRNTELALAHIALEERQISTEGWEAYEKRWLPGTCPQENHVVHLTWLVSKYPLPKFAYERLRALIEDGAEPEGRASYEDRHFSATRVYDGRPAVHAGAPGGLR